MRHVIHARLSAARQAPDLVRQARAQQAVRADGDAVLGEEGQGEGVGVLEHQERADGGGQRAAGAERADGEVARSDAGRQREERPQHPAGEVDGQEGAAADQLVQLRAGAHEDQHVHEEVLGVLVREDVAEEGGRGRVAGGLEEVFVEGPPEGWEAPGEEDEEVDVEEGEAG